jgi:hypothetical protein
MLVGAWGFMTFVTAGSGTAQREKTPLELRVETAREIRAALQRPLPPIEPLPPLTRKAARETSKPVESSEAKRDRPPRAVSIEARDAMARAEWQELLASTRGGSSGRAWALPSGSERSSPTNSLPRRGSRSRLDW